MGLMKTLCQSSKELKDILDRLTALENGDTFVTNEQFNEKFSQQIETALTEKKIITETKLNEQLSNGLKNINQFFTATVPASSSIEVALPSFVTWKNYANFVVLNCVPLGLTGSRWEKEAYPITLNGDNIPVITLNNNLTNDRNLLFKVVSREHVFTSLLCSLSENTTDITLNGDKLPLSDTVDFTIVGATVNKKIAPNSYKTISPSDIGLTITQTLDSGKYRISVARTDTTDYINVYIKYCLYKTLS